MPLAFDPSYLAAIEPLIPFIASRPKPQLHDIPTRRANLHALFSHVNASLPFPSDIVQRTFTIPSSASYSSSHPIEILHTYPKPPASGPPSSPATGNFNTPGPALLHAHPGGFFAGSPFLIATHIAHSVARHRIPTFSVRYRLAPEHPFPAAHEDVFAALLYLHAHAAELGIDPARIGLLGESAGGGIVVGVALMARDRGVRPGVRKVIVVAPMIDDGNTTVQKELEGLVVWDWEANVTGWDALLGRRNLEGKQLKKGDGEVEVSPYAAPCRAESFEGFPEVYVECPELDIFRRETVEWVGRLGRENPAQRCEFHVWKGVPHAWELLVAGKGMPLLDTVREVRTRALQEI